MDLHQLPTKVYSTRSFFSQSNHLLRMAAVVAGLCCLALLTACQPVGGRGQLNVGEDGVLLSADTAIGQTFTSTFNGLNGIRIHFSPQTPGDGKITLMVYASPAKSALLAQAELPFQVIEKPGFFTFVFAQPLTGANQSYYLELRSSGSGQVAVGTAGPDTYLDGSLYQNGVAQVRQLSFMPVYDPAQMAQGVAMELLTWAGWLLACLFGFILPGWALLYLLAGAWLRQLPFGSRFSLASAAGLALYPILFLLTWLVGLKIGVFLAFAPGAAALAWLVWRLYRTRADWAHFSPRPINLQVLLPHLAYAVVVAWIIFLRLWAVRTLPMPMWGDSVHHTMITELIIQNQGLFQSWLPLAEMQSLTYHFGFHIFAAVLHWLTGLAAPQAVLLTGQALNILAVLSIYPLAAKAARQNPWAGVAALVVTGCLISMPMFYTNWGRYTQLAGQVILCGAVYLLWELFETDQPSWKLAALVGLVWGGLALTHYRVMVFAVLAVPGFAVFYSGKLAWRALWLRYRYLLAAGVIAGLLFLPWFVHVYGGAIYANMLSKVTTMPQAVSEFGREYNAIGSLETYLPARIWALAAFAAAVGFYRRQKEIVLVCIWALLVVFAANPGWFGLPGSGALSNFAVFIAAYIFAGILIGAAFGWLAAAPVRRFQGVFALALLLGLLGAGGYYGRQRLNDLSPESSALITRADLRAAQWIEANTPADARIAVNSFFAYGGSVLAGADGGWWLPQLTGRLTTLPPMLYTSEVEPYPGFIRAVNGQRALIDAQGGYASLEVVRSLWDSGVRYAYVGQRGGRVNSPANTVLMDAAQMEASGYYKVVYHQDLVWVLEIPTRP
jgi:hypothetical protein